MAKTFELKTKLSLSYDWNVDNPGDDEDEYRREMEENYISDVEDFIMSDTLRAKPVSGF